MNGINKVVLTKLRRGYSPTSGLVSNLPQAQATYFDRDFMDFIQRDFIQNLKQLTPFYRYVERRELPPVVQYTTTTDHYLLPRS